jgi:uncharacterized oxidoreductase
LDHPLTTTIAVDTIQSFIADIFRAAGCTQEEAGRIAMHLLSANLAGHDSHGVIRVPRYVQWLQEGGVHAGRSISIVTETPTHALVDGNRGFGQTIGEQAVDLGIAKAKQAGIAVIALRNTGHLGRIGDWAERAAAAGLVSIHFVNVASSELVAPFGGTQKRFGTNPVCIGVPMDDEPMLLLDFATSLVAEGKVLVASNGGKKLPEGALIGPDGKLSTDPQTLYGPIGPGDIRDGRKGPGAMRTFGDHKGSGLAFMCEILAGCFTGGGTARDKLSGGGIANGMLSIYIDPTSFGTAHFAQTARDFADHVKATHPADPNGEVLVPGEPEARNKAHRLAEGIPLQADTWAAIVATGRRLGLTPPV